MMGGAAPRPVCVEICVASAADARLAADCGADRVELNAALELGGLTPSLGTLIEARASVSIPLVAMVRPRAGGFCYDGGEFDAMLRDTDLMAGHGVDGIAFGILTPDAQVDVNRCREMIRRAHGLGEGAVFHRAFDFVKDPTAALEQLIDLGVRRVMTSGGRSTALEGAREIAELIGRAGGRIEVLPAGRIRAQDVRELIHRTGCDQVHASCRERRSDPLMATAAPFSLGAVYDSGLSHLGASPRLVRELVAAVLTNG